MGVIGPRGSKRRPQYLGDLVLTRPTKHGLVASFWPRNRGKTNDTYQLSIQRNLTAVTKAVLRMHPREIEPLRLAVQAVNKANSGFRGTAAIRIEDLLTQNMMGRFLAMNTAQLGMLYHVNVKNDISRRLDWMEPSAGSILTRTSQTWLPTIPCEEGAICRLMPEIPMPGCCPPAQPTPNEV